VRRINLRSIAWGERGREVGHENLVAIFMLRWLYYFRSISISQQKARDTGPAADSVPCP